MIKLQRLSDRPVLKPQPHHPWEAAAVFNPGAIFDKGLIHLVYRATDVSSNGKVGKYINNLGYAVSSDGIHFNRLVEPVLANDVDQELRGPEDPRIVKIGNIFYMTYTGYGGRFDGDYRICLASSQNMIDWRRHGVLLDEPNKDASLFPEKINGRYAMFHRRPPDIWIAYSDDMRHWSDHQIVMKAKPNSSWENYKIGIGGPPVKTGEGWFLIYHGVGEGPRYCLGAALLDPTDPTKVLARQPEPLLEPELEWELQGHVPNAIFSCGQVILDNQLIVYYGGADTVIGAAGIHLEELAF